MPEIGLRSRPGLFKRRKGPKKLFFLFQRKRVTAKRVTNSLDKMFGKSKPKARFGTYG